MPWVVVADAGEVGDGAIVPVDTAGRELVVWRDGEGRACVMDARCPHQWSHLAAEGVVVGDEVVCAAHFWRFDREGRGSKLNMRGRRDPKADIGVLPCREHDGVIEAELGGSAHPPTA
jgi:phenylpropionate dioxygenase-like ring-hydroxylating dioxygenase large terminal subunit